MSGKVNSTATSSVAIATKDLAWAREGLGFRLGKGEWRDRLKAIGQWLGGQGQIVAESGAPEGTVGSWLKRGSQPRDPEHVAALARAAGLSEAYVSTGAVENHTDLAVEELRLNLARAAFAPTGSSAARRAAREAAVAEARRAITERRNALSQVDASRGAVSVDEDMVSLAEAGNFIALPRYEVNASAGSGLLALNESVRERLAFRRDWLHQVGVQPAHAALLNAAGDSMSPTIPDGALMLVDRNPDQPIRSGYIYVIVLHGDVLVKRVSRNVDGTIDLIADNPLYPKQTVHQADLDRLNIAGRVAWVAHAL